MNKIYQLYQVSKNLFELKETKEYKFSLNFNFTIVKGNYTLAILLFIAVIVGVVLSLI